jgi:hypothetical protein
MMSAAISVTPMKASGIEHQVARVYREGGDYQWVRETLINSVEAKATRIEFGIEWQAVEERGVYRRLIADNGIGMTSEELVGFFNVWGGGGKPIGGVHENFGIGAKSSLLPWNRYGLVVISWVDGEAAMIWVMADPSTGQFGLRNFDAEVKETGEDRIVEVVAPFPDDEHGCDWNTVRPDFIEDHGTVIVLLGEDPNQNTVVGDPSRPAEANAKGISNYLNRRLWKMPVTVEEVRVAELLADPKAWPTSDSREARESAALQRRKIEGAKHHLEYPVASFTKGKLAAAGTVSLNDDTEVDWFLWEGDRPRPAHAAGGGFIAALYKDELYDVTNHHSMYRTFGVIPASVRSKLWLIMRPTPFDERDTSVGVYPRADRNSLLIMGGARAGDPLPFPDWGAEFAEKMPEPIRQAIRAARAGDEGTVTEDAWRQRLADRFGSRWRIPKLRARIGGKHTVAAAQPGSKPQTPKATTRSGGGGGGRRGGTIGRPNTGSAPGTVQAIRTNVAGGIPTYLTVHDGDIDAGMLAAWVKNHPDHPEGAVLINVDHPVLEDQIVYWQSQYPDHLAEEIETEVIATYGEIAVAKLAHSEQLKSILPSSKVEDDLRSEAALTMSLLGLIGEEAVIAPRIGGKFGRRAA